MIDSPLSNRPNLTAGRGALKRAGGLWLRFSADVFSFEVAFVLFVFAGRYKSDPRVSWVPVDLTLLFLLLSAAAAAWVLFRRGFRFSRAAMFTAFGIVIFITWMMVSVAWTPSRNYGPQKALELGTLVLWAGVGPAIIIAPDPRRFVRFTYATMLLAGLLAADGLANYLQFGVVYSASESYLGLGGIAGFGTAMALVQLSGSGGYLGRLCISLLLLLYVFVLWTAGGRGPVLSTLACVLVLAMSSIRLTRGIVQARLAGAILMLLIAGASVLFWVGPESHTLTRFIILLTQESGGRSAGIRLHYYESTIGIISSAPLLGHGIGSWPIEMGLTDAQAYPHNIFLETFAEGGIVGVLLLVIAIAIGFRHLLIGGIVDQPMKLTVLLLFVNTFIFAQTTGDLPANRLLFTTMGLMAIGPSRTKLKSALSVSKGGR